jgi:sec-independent protein translocase protein TatA
MFGTIGMPEMMMIFLVALVLFGPKKLPELGKTIGKAITEFRRASSDLKSSFEREMQNLERETESLKESTYTSTDGTSDFYSHNSYEYPYDSSAANGATISAEPHDSTATHPTTVGASEVPGAESQGKVEAASHPPAAETKPAVEGTVPRTEMPVETPQHS